MNDGDDPTVERDVGVGPLRGGDGLAVRPAGALDSTGARRLRRWLRSRWSEIAFVVAVLAVVALTLNQLIGQAVRRLPGL